MSLSAAIFILIVLIIVSAILSSAEISLAGARRIKLQTLANEGNIQAEKVLKLQEQPGRFYYCGPNWTQYGRRTWRGDW